MLSISMPRELARLLDLSDFPCAVCGAPSVAEHFDFVTELLVKLCKEHKFAAVERDCR
jgi:hypothetical protein